jgi:signal peptidase I
MYERHRSATGLKDAVRTAGKPPAPKAAGHRAREWISTFLVAFALFLIIRAFLVEAFRIPTESMENTLLVGDFLLVNKAVFGAAIPVAAVRTPAFSEPVRGDVVVFRPPHATGHRFVKRLVGTPGDTLHMIGKVLYVNGRPQEEWYVKQHDPADMLVPAMSWQCDFAPGPRTVCRPTRDNWGPLVVPARHVFVLGDNRDESEDSRHWGFVHRRAIIGRPAVIYYSVDPTARRPFHWLTGIRWDRIGHAVH